MYYLVWNGEIIESEIETINEAEYLKREYTIAYGGVVRIKKEQSC